MEESIPGTLRLFDADGNPLVTEGTGLKKHGDIVLVPQPTDSPNDPLHWSMPRKIWHSVLVCFVTALTAATSNDAGAAQYNENLEIGVSYGSFNTGAGVLFVGIGYWCLLSSPMVYLYGRRILYLICMLFGLIGVSGSPELRLPAALYGTNYLLAHLNLWLKRPFNCRSWTCGFSISVVQS